MNKNLWAEAINTAVFVINHTGTSRIKGKTPSELWWNRPMYDISNLRVFGSKVGVHIPTQRRLKFDSKADIGYFVGYGESINIKGYRIYLPEKNNVETKRDVTFIKETNRVENVKKSLIEHTEKIEVITFDCNEHNQERTEEENQEDYDQVENYENTSNQQSVNSFNEEYDTLSVEEGGEEIPEVTNEITEEETNTGQEELYEERPKRIIRTPAWMEDYKINQQSESSENSFLSISCEEPITYAEAMKRPDRVKWEEAIKREMKTLEENNTWEEIEDMPNGEEIVSSKWVFKIKETEGNSMYKARLVARGFEQKNCDNNTYAPVAKMTTFRTLMAVASQKRQPVYQMDVTGAFLYGDIKETVFMRLPNNKICRLKKSIYGLKKSPRYWNTKFNDFIIRENFERSKNDPCLYIKKGGNDYMYVLLFVDDLLYFGNNKSQLNSFKTALCDNFKMKDLGLASNYLGINIKQDHKNSVTVINQKKYLQKLLDSYQMSECKSVSTPIEQNFNFDLLKRDKPESVEIEKDCRSLIGSLLYACNTRPDLSVAVSFLSRYLHCASKALYQCLKRILRYVKGTIDLSLTYMCNKNISLQGYSDADWAGDARDRKSTSGQIFYFSDCPISWGTKKQSCVSLSSCEAEYVALTLTVSEALWLKKLLLDFDYKISCNIFEDNQSVIKIVENNDNNKRLKHMDIKYHWLMDNINKGFVNINYVKTNCNIADMFTKPLGKQLFIKLRDLILFNVL